MSLVMVSAADLWAHAGGRGFSVRGALVMLADRLCPPATAASYFRLFVSCLSVCLRYRGLFMHIMPRPQATCESVMRA